MSLGGPKTPRTGKDALGARLSSRNAASTSEWKSFREYSGSRSLMAADAWSQHVGLPHIAFEMAPPVGSLSLPTFWGKR